MLVATLASAMSSVFFQVSSQVLLFLLIAGMSGSCDTKLFLSQFRRPKGIAAGLVCHYLVMPLLGYATVTIFPQPPVTVVTLLIITTSPSGGFSGFWCSLWNADLAVRAWGWG